MKRIDAVSLVEVLVVSAILSSSMLAIMGLIHSSSRGAVLNERRLLAGHVASNMAERYRLMPVELLEEVFGDGQGGDMELAHDPILNVDGIHDYETLRALGLRRRVTFHRGDAVRPSILMCEVEWDAGSRRQRVVSIGEVAGTGRGVVGSAPAPVEQFLVGESSVVVQMIAYARRQDSSAEGTEAYPWPDESVTDFDGLAAVLRRRSIPAGVYECFVERFPLSASRTAMIVTLASSEERYLKLIEEFRLDPEGDDSVIFVSSRPTRAGSVYRIERFPPMGSNRTDGSPTPSEETWAYELVTTSRLYALLPSWSAEGVPSRTERRMVVVDLDVPWRVGQESAFLEGLAETRRRIGLSEKPVDDLQSVRGIRSRLGL